MDGTPAQQLGATFTGTVHDGISSAPAGAPVVAYIADLDGRKLASIGSTVTDQNGTFSVLVNGFMAPSSAVVLEATLPSGTFHAYLSSTTPTLNPVTEGVYRVIQQIVGTERGRYTTDFTPDEIQQLLQEGADALQSNAVDLTDRVAVHQALLAHVGQRFVAASGGLPHAQLPGGRMQVTDPPGLLAPWGGGSLMGAELWDIDNYGAITNGTSDAYDTMFDLDIDGFWFPSQSGNAQLQDGRTAVLGPAVGYASGLDVTRKIYVPEGKDWARFTEVLTNPGSTEVTVTVRISGNLGSDESTDLADFTSSGDQIVDGTDLWIVNHKGGSDPALGFLFPGAAAFKSSDDVEYQWSATVPAGGTVTLMHWAFQRSDKSMLNMVERLEAMGENPLPEYFAQVSQAEIDSALNVGAAANVGGDAGAFVPGEALTVTNQTSGASKVGRAAEDGSFGVTMQTASGDVIQISGDAGSEHTLTVQ